ncbi:hypothetical protein P8X24_03615 [Pyrococcus kukulkanii]|uniref:hypothetical protein n=1 Tax=Pyrococcus kukulkanii TaxID=1609559 RepID=UPI003565B106
MNTEKNKLALISFFLILAIAVYIIITPSPEDRYPYESLRPIKALPNIRTLEVIDEKSYTLNAIVFNRNNETVNWTLYIDLPHQIWENAEVLFINNGFILMETFSIVPNATFFEINWSNDIVTLERGALKFKLNLPPKSYTIIPVVVVFKKWPSYPLGKLIEGEIITLGNSTYKVAYTCKGNCTVEIWIPKKVGYSEKYGIEVDKYKEKVRGLFKSLKSEYGLLIVGKNVEEALRRFEGYEDVESPEGYCLIQKAEGEEIYSKDWMSYMGAPGYYTSGEYYVKVFKKSNGSITFTTTGTCEPKVIIKATIIKNTPLVKVNIPDPIYPTKSVVVITQSIITGAKT